ncbi:MAG: hypothetical protein FWH18_05830 [Marinilabiliaceae bacterium]|nr:hypothetical protein [Marinilabiliaceae bacterium]
MKQPNILEEEVKNVVAQKVFKKFDCTRILGKIDFAVKPKLSVSAIDFVEIYFLWSEVKKHATDVLIMLTQLILTIGKARTFDQILPPMFLGCFDNEKIAFIPYSEIQHIFYQNDFNWKVAPSDHKTREFKQIHTLLEKFFVSISWQTYIFYFEKDEKELNIFINENFIVGKTETSRTKIDKNNFITIYGKWFETVKPTIAVDWDAAKKDGIIDGDFYLADLLSSENNTISENLHVLLKSKYYEFDKVKLKSGVFHISRIDFNDNQKAYEQFWAKYERPPAKEYWNYIVDRRDLIVPQDVRERKGSFYTPKIWVELSQKYLADVFGVDWQDEYYVWDCAAGTGNLIVGLTNKYNIWASTLDKQDLGAMKERIQNGANLLESHVFQFDFLNDDFSKLPNSLLDVINDPIRRKKLIIYINPPYAESTSYGIKSKEGVSSANKTYEKYKNIVGIGINEIFAQFFIHIFSLIPDCKLASFSTLKYINSQNFVKFRNIFKAEFKKGFICRSNTFDNVNGKFPIGFLVWDLNNKKQISKIKLDVFDADKEVTRSYFMEKKSFFPVEKGILIIDWLRNYFDKKSEKIAYLRIQGTDFQTNSTIVVSTQPTMNDVRESKITHVTINNLKEMSVYFAVRKCIEHTWINHNFQFLFPNKKWQFDVEFHNDCLAFTMFHRQNTISIKYGVNHWIPFTENEVNAKERFESHFMISFLSGKVIPNAYSNLFAQEENKFYTKPVFSPQATKVFDAGRELWKYYHSQPNININASLYDIREHFQGRNEKGKMNNKSKNNTYNALMDNLRDELKILAQKIEPKIYEYGFLMK